jgi:hypothetical protein
MGPGWPPYDCEIKLFHATWHDTLACDDFKPKAGFQHLSKAYKEQDNKRWVFPSHINNDEDGKGDKRKQKRGLRTD